MARVTTMQETEKMLMVVHSIAQLIQDQATLDPFLPKPGELQRATAFQVREKTAKAATEEEKQTVLNSCVASIAKSAIISKRH